MHIVVIGAGAVGGYFGGKLAASDSKVTFLVRQGRYLQLRETGLQIRSTYGDFTIQPSLAVSASEIHHPDVVLLAVKNYHLADIFPQIQVLLDKGAKILPLLNGVEHIQVLTQRFGQHNVLGGSCYIEAALDEKGRVLHTSPMHDIVFGALGEIDESWLKSLEAAFSASGVKVKLSQHVLQEMWKKFIFLVTFSGMTAACRLPIGPILQDETSSLFLQDVIREILQVAELEQVGLSTKETFEQMLYRFQKTSPQMTSSLYRDLEKRLPLEIDSLQGSVLRMAAKHNIAVPATRALYALLHPFIKGGNA